MEIGLRYMWLRGSVLKMSSGSQEYQMHQPSAHPKSPNTNCRTLKITIQGEINCSSLTARQTLGRKFERSFERKKFRMKSAWEEAPHLMSPCNNICRKLDKVYNANSAFIFINLSISCQSGSIGQGGPGCPCGPDGPLVQVVQVVHIVQVVQVMQAVRWSAERPSSPSPKTQILKTFKYKM